MRPRDGYWAYWVSFEPDIACWIPGDEYDEVRKKSKELWDLFWTLNQHLGLGDYASAEADRSVFEATKGMK